MQRKPRAETLRAARGWQGRVAAWRAGSRQEIDFDEDFTAGIARGRFAKDGIGAGDEPDDIGGVLRIVDQGKRSDVAKKFLKGCDSTWVGSRVNGEIVRRISIGERGPVRVVPLK